MKHSKFSRMIS